MYIIMILSPENPVNILNELHWNFCGISQLPDLLLLGFSTTSKKCKLMKLTTKPEKMGEAEFSRLEVYKWPFSCLLSDKYRLMPSVIN